MTPPDQLDLEALDAFLASRIGQVFQERLLDMGKRHTKVTQDRRASLDDIRASQGALEVLYVVMELGNTLRRELAARTKEKKNAG